MVLRQARNLFQSALLGGILLLFPGCQSRHAQPPVADEATTLSLLERQLLEVIAAEDRLEQLASSPEPDEREVQRIFHDVVRDYEGIIARNPNHLESRLLFGKLLSRYGDREGAYQQFLLAARINPEIAVIHQELSTYHAEEGDPTRAMAYALNAVELAPEVPAYHFGLGQLLAAYRPEYLAEGVYTEAEIDREMLAAFQTAASLKPDSLDLQLRYGEAFYDAAEPDWETALAHWRWLLGWPGLTPLRTDAIHLHILRCLIELGRWEAAEAEAGFIQSEVFREPAEALLQWAPEP